MNIRVCMAKIHNATVTEANPGYKGSISICPLIMKAAGIRPCQMLIINNCRNGDTWQTYAMLGKEGQICLNGKPPAHHFQKGDVVIILAEAWVSGGEYENLAANVVFVDDKNKIIDVKSNNLADLFHEMFVVTEDLEAS